MSGISDRALEAAQRAQTHARGQRVAAPRAGPEDCQIVRSRRAAIFGLDREARRGRHLRVGRRDKESNRRKRRVRRAIQSLRSLRLSRLL